MTSYVSPPKRRNSATVPLRRRFVVDSGRVACPGCGAHPPVEPETGSAGRSTSPAEVFSTAPEAVVEVRPS